MIHDKFDLQGVIDRLEKTKHDLPLVLANQAETFFQASFKKQGWDSNGVDKWQPRKRNRTARDVTRNILIKSGALRRSIKTYEANFNQIIIGSDIPYAKVHNDGFRGVQYVKPHKRSSAAVTTSVYGSPTFVNGVWKRGKRRTVRIGDSRKNIGGYTRKMNMPKRQFIGDSVTLQKMQSQTITKVLDTIWR